MSYFAYHNGTLCAEDVPLTEIADAFGTPTFVYSRSAIEDAYRRFDTAFSSHRHRTCYAVKANANLGVLSLLASLGAGFDVVSGGELERVLRAGGNAGHVVFSGVGKQDWEISKALCAGIACFNVESQSELDQINRISGQLNLVAPISVRVNPDVDANTHPYISTGLKQNKFGVSPAVARDMYHQATSLPHIKVVGIDCHIGSQITEIEPFIEAMRRITEIVDDLENDGVTLEHIDLGGGIGVQYQDESPLDIEAYASAILQVLGHRRQELLFEPGRYIVANAGVLLSRVVNLKQNEGKYFAVIDAGMNDLIRPALYQSWQGISVVTPNSNVESHAYDVVGPICETGDFIARQRDLALSAEDLVAIHSAGAYAFSMSSNYNTRGRAAEIIVSNDTMQCVRVRESIDDQLRLEQTYIA